MIDYAKAINARQEVIDWCSTVLAARLKKLQSGHAIALIHSEAEHIIDFLASDAAPKRLRKMSYQQAKEAAEKWMKANQKKGRNLVDGEGDIETIHDFGDGSRIVRLITPNAYKREGFFMAHCVGGYDPKTSTIYSYRDKKNEPHATFEVAKRDNQIVQIKGKGNGSIHPNYINPILTFLKSINFEIRPDDMKNLGYLYIPEGFEEILSLFVEPNGQETKMTTLFGHKYMYAGVCA
jgi:hypothetical protein